MSTMIGKTGGADWGIYGKNQDFFSLGCVRFEIPSRHPGGNVQ